MYNINEITISRLSNKYNFPYTIHTNRVYIKSKYDEWYAEQEEKGKIILYHKNKADSGYHFQREFYDFPFMFQSIKQHDDYNLSPRWNIYKHSRTAKLFDMVSCELHSNKKHNKNKTTYI